MLSSVAVIIGLWFTVVAVQTHGIHAFAAPHPWFVFAFMMFIAVTPWVFGQAAPSSSNPSRAFGLAMIFIGIGIIGFAVQSSYVPEHCSDRRSTIVCEFLNWVFSIGGALAVGVLQSLFGLLFLVGGYFIVKRRSKS